MKPSPAPLQKHSLGDALSQPRYPTTVVWAVDFNCGSKSIRSITCGLVVQLVLRVTNPWQIEPVEFELICPRVEPPSAGEGEGRYVVSRSYTLWFTGFVILSVTTRALCRPFEAHNCDTTLPTPCVNRTALRSTVDSRAPQQRLHQHAWCLSSTDRRNQTTDNCRLLTVALKNLRRSREKVKSLDLTPIKVWADLCIRRCTRHVYKQILAPVRWG